MRSIKEGDHVRFFDEHWTEHNALVTAVWGTPSEEWMPCINLVFVVTDAAKKDPYGRQIDRRTSVAHAASTKLKANSYLLVGEELA